MQSFFLTVGDDDVLHWNNFLFLDKLSRSLELPVATHRRTTPKYLWGCVPGSRSLDLTVNCWKIPKTLLGIFSSGSRSQGLTVSRFTFEGGRSLKDCHVFWITNNFSEAVGASKFPRQSEPGVNSEPFHT